MSDEEYDPSEHTVDEVKDHVEANPGMAGRIFELEEDGKARSTLLSWLEDRLQEPDEEEDEDEGEQAAQSNPNLTPSGEPFRSP